MKKPIVTFLIPCYNASEYINDALTCVINQTYKELEILLIDDGSTDNTLGILREFEDKDSRIKVIVNEVNIGLIKTLNKGVDLATGEYIARFDADDKISFDRIEKQIEIIHENKNIDLITSYVDYITPNGRFHSHVESFYCYTFNSIKFLNLFECPLVHAGMLIKTDILKSMKYSFKSQYMHIEDYELFSRLIESKVGIFVNTEKSQRYLYRRNPTSVSNRNKEIQIENAVNLSINNLKNVLNYSIEKEHAKAIILKGKINWTPTLIIKSISEFKKIKLLYFNIEKERLTKLDKKLITEWYFLRCMKIFVTILIEGNFTCKILAILCFFKNSKFLFHLKFYLNIKSRIVYIINRIRYKN